MHAHSISVRDDAGSVCKCECCWHRSSARLCAQHKLTKYYNAVWAIGMMAASSWTQKKNGKTHIISNACKCRNTNTQRKTQKTVSHIFFSALLSLSLRWFRLAMFRSLGFSRKESNESNGNSNNHNNVGDLCDTVICFKYFFSCSFFSGCFVWLSCLISTQAHSCVCELQSACTLFPPLALLLWLCFDLWKILLGKA